MENSLEASLVQLLKARNQTCATAESCTGGGIAARITSVPGASDVFKGGIVSYVNAVKHALLGVPQSILDTVGAVSSDCARAMAEGARRALKTDWAVSVTGLAGPGGGTPEKPVGLVYIGLAGPSGPAQVRECHFTGDRDAIRRQTSTAALTLLHDRLSPVSPGQVPPRSILNS